MSTATKTLMSADEFFEYAHRPENIGKFLELVQGEVVEMPPPTKPHGFVCANVARILGNHAVKSNTGYVCSNDTGIIVQRSPDTVRGPDVCYFVDDQTIDTMDRKYAEHPPVLIVEVRSPDDREKKIQRRLREYLQIGVAMIWLVDPEDRYVTVHEPGKLHQVLEENDELTGGLVLSGFRCTVGEFFVLPGRPNNR